MAANKKATAKPAKPGKHPTLAVQLVEQLRQMIFDGDLESGTRLAEEDLSQRFGVSRTPLREALKLLTSEGLITIAPNRGATVTQLSMNELAETFPVMGVLEALAGELAATHATDDDLTELQALHDEIVRQYKAKNLKAYFAANQRFHERLVSAAHNETLGQHYHQLAGRVRRARYSANLSARRWAQSVSEHEQIIKLLKTRDGDLLAKVLRAHIDHKFETIRDVIENTPT
jgi:DNA-binding GntR family transcriptional regulator